MKRHTLLLVGLCCATALLTLSGAAPPQAQTTHSLARVVRVVDGDTVDVQLADGRTERLRLIGIDNPEVVGSRKPVQCFGRAASARAHDFTSSTSCR